MITYSSQSTGPAQWGAVPFGRPAMNPSLQDIFNRLPPTYLDEVRIAALQDRIDTKYLLTEEQAAAIFDRLLDRYKVLEVEGYRGGHYRTLYFDTPALDMFSAHHAGVRPRFKVRMRSYVDSRISFLEVKRKTNRNRTVKTRIPAEAALTIGDEGAAFLATQCPYNPADLVPRIYNEFIRVTLVGMQHVERLTLDFAVSLGIDDIRVDLPGLVVVEVKQKKLTAQAGIFRQLHDLHLLPTSFSKYVFATTQLTEDVRQNRFKERHMHVAEVMRAWESLNRSGY
jgi:hypothetical protein